MRNALPKLGKPEQPRFADQSHIGLAYDSWAPTGEDGKVPDDDRGDWLAELTQVPVAVDYRRAFARWRSSFAAPGHILLNFTLASRLLIGHGNSSATEVGLTVHHTWGAPIILGSALKGLCAHYTVSNYGPNDLTIAPRKQPVGEEKERASFQGVLWDKTLIKTGPGGFYRRMFGAPDAQDDEMWSQEGWPVGAARGGVTFHDALYVPGSAKKNENDANEPDCPFVEDVLTIHQKKYYDAGGMAAQGAPEPWPNDYGSPIPVSFLTVRPGARFLLALSAPSDAESELTLAAFILGEALREWGVGGKTSLGYGRGEVQRIENGGNARP